jgi:hypothetical protein
MSEMSSVEGGEDQVKCDPQPKNVCSERNPDSSKVIASLLRVSMHIGNAGFLHDGKSQCPSLQTSFL